MKFQKELIEGKLLSRYKRFFADVEYTAEYVNEKNKTKKVTIHVPNTGSMKGVIDKVAAKSQKCWFSLHGDETKKLKGTLESIQTVDGTWVGVNTSNPNKIVTEEIQNSFKTGKPFLKHWSEYTFYKPEYKISKESRLDGLFVFKKDDLDNEKIKKHFIEIKNTTYKAIIGKKSHAQFPDAVTERGQKHIRDMMHLLKQGHKCELIFTVQRSDVDVFSPCDEFDPEYGRLLREAIGKGLIVTPLLVDVSRSEVILTNKVLKVII